MEICLSPVNSPRSRGNSKYPSSNHQSPASQPVAPALPQTLPKQTTAKLCKYSIHQSRQSAPCKDSSEHLCYVLKDPAARNLGAREPGKSKPTHHGRSGSVLPRIETGVFHTGDAEAEQIRSRSSQCQGRFHACLAEGQQGIVRSGRNAIRQTLGVLDGRTGVSGLEECLVAESGPGGAKCLCR